MNKRQIIGRLGQDAVKGKTQNGSEFVAFNVAATSGYGERRQVEWIDCLLMGHIQIAPYLKKGTYVYCDGDASMEEYKGKPKAKMMVRSIELLSANEGRHDRA